jgi:hypothetical protein
MNQLLFVLSLTCCSLLVQTCGTGSSTPPPTTYFSVKVASTTAIAGTPFNIMLGALDAFGALVSTSSGTTGTSNALPASPLAGTTHFSVTAPAATTAGTAFKLTVIALDAGNNTVTSYSGTVHFTSTDSKAVLPANSRLTNGKGTFSATLKTLGAETITTTDTVRASIKGTSNTISVSGPATHFSLTAPTTVTSGVAFSLKVTALDASNNVAIGYSGTVHITSTDAKALLPANSTLTNGSGTFSARLYTTGRQTIKATDTKTTSITGTSNVITVFAGRCTPEGMECPPQFPPCCPGLTCVPASTRAFCLALAEPSTVKIASRFTAACTMETPRESHSATLLDTGIVLITGGDDGNAALATAELFNPNTHTFAAAGDMVTARARHTATLLPNGAVLVIGGRDRYGNTLASAELFDPATMSFGPTGGMATVRESHTATLLRNGKVLINGGDDGYTPMATAELFDPATGLFAPTGSMASERTYQTATLLKDGKVLVAGGRDAHGNILATAELFDPGTGKFTPAGSMQSARQFHTATVLTNGKVLVTGGDDGTTILATAELFDPATGAFTPVGTMQQARELHTATLRTDGTVLVVGGAGLPFRMDGGSQTDLPSESTATAELFDPSSGSFTTTSDMANPRARHAATLLLDGAVLISGGTLLERSAGRELSAFAELFK